MASVDVTINGHRYQIACDDGEEQRLARLAEFVDERVQDLVVAVGQVGDTRLLVMTSLMIADELYEAQAALNRHGIDVEDDAPATGADGDTDALARAIEDMAERIETIAAGLERA